MSDVTTDYAGIAAGYGVSAEIHPSDHIFRFMREHPVVGPRAAAEYFSDGRDCAVKLRTLIEDQRPVDSVSILEFASGYGRVTRHLPKVIPEATLTACDIHAEAVRFIDQPGVECILSCEKPDDFNAGRAFDVVFALSFFSHIPKTTWTRWLRRLLDYTLPGGLLIFTTHGERSRKLAAPDSVPGDDFSFLPDSEQSDLPTEQYGAAFSPFAFVKRQIATLADARLVKFQEEYWWTHQDLYVLTRAMASYLTPGGKRSEA
jgi:SAM-dependent methyltransferase